MLRILLWDRVYPPPAPPIGEYFMMGIAVLLGLALVAGVFLLFRAGVLWYWRVNEIAVELRAIRGELRQIRRGDKDEPPTTWG